jgi:hypothetical protein
MTARPLIANGIPKSGTYFLDAIVKATGLWQPTGLHLAAPHTVVRHADGTTTTEPRPAVDEIPKLQPGTFANAHMIWTAEIEAAILEANVKHVLIIRDPRDTIVSMMRWQTYNPQFVTTPAERQRQTELQLGFVNDADRLKHFIMLMRWNDFAQYAPWLKSPACHVVRFEPLYTELASASDDMPTVKALFAYLEIPMPPAEQLRAALHIGITSSGEKNKVGAWRDLFTAEHLQLLDYPQFKESMAALGYDANHPALTKTEIYEDDKGRAMRREYWDVQHPLCPKEYRLYPDLKVYVRAEPALA